MTTEQPATRPIPEIDEAWAPFFEAARRGQLMISRCTRCATYLAPGTALCPECFCDGIEWVPASGRGTLFTFGIMHQRYHPGFAAEIPYNVAVVELEEGPRINTNIVGVRNDELRVGMPVVVTFEQLTEQVTVPKFKPA